MQDTKPEKPVDEEELEIERKMVKVISLMPKDLQNRFKALKVLSDRRSKMNDQFEEEQKVLSEATETKKKPLYEKRQLIIKGEETNFAERAKTFDARHDQLLKELEGVKTESEDIPEVDVKHLVAKPGISDFWFKAIKNCRMFQDNIEEKDEEILKHLTNVESERSSDPETLVIRFFFSENEFFTNSELTMKLFYDKDRDETEKIESTAIEWKEGKDATKKKIKKKQKNKKTGETRTIVKTVEGKSFFNAFITMEAPKDDEDDDSQGDAEEGPREKFEMAINTAEDVDEVLIPDALEYYLGIQEDIDDDSDAEDCCEEVDGKQVCKKKAKKGGESDGDDSGEGEGDKP